MSTDRRHMTQKEFWTAVAADYRIAPDRVVGAWEAYGAAKNMGTSSSGHSSIFGQSFVKTLITNGVITAEICARAMAERKNWPLHRHPSLDTEVLERIGGKEKCRRHLAAPIIDPARSGQRAVIIICVDPEMDGWVQFRNSAQAIFHGSEIEYRIGTLTDVESCLDRGSAAGSEQPAAQLDAEITPELIEADLATAFRRRASDFHLECVESGIRIRIRVDGRMERLKRVPVALRTSYIAQLKLASGRGPNESAAAGMDSSQNAISQGAATVREYGGKRVSLRFSGSPSGWGYNIVVRFIDQTTIMGLKLSDLGYRHSVEKQLEAGFRADTSLNAFLGTTGSGKSTSLYCGLRTLDLEEGKIITVENPIEVRFAEGLDQREVTVQEGFADKLKYILQQDPDVIVPAETRDLEVLKLLLQGAQSGHLCWTTLHVDNPFQAIQRFLGWGVDAGAFANFIRLFCAQRLAPRLCPKCRREDPLSAKYLKEMAPLLEAYKDDMAIMLKGAKPQFFAIGPGCPHCEQRGMIGRILFSESYQFRRPDIDRILREGISYNAGAAREDARRLALLARINLANLVAKVAELESSLQTEAPLDDRNATETKIELEFAHAQLLAARDQLAIELVTMREDALLKAAAGLVTMASVKISTEEDNPLSPPISL